LDLKKKLLFPYFKSELLRKFMDENNPESSSQKSTEASNEKHTQNLQKLP
jgi:hypothetical protein